MLPPVLPLMLEARRVAVLLPLVTPPCTGGLAGCPAAAAATVLVVLEAVLEALKADSHGGRSSPFEREEPESTDRLRRLRTSFPDLTVLTKSRAFNLGSSSSRVATKSSPQKIISSSEGGRRSCKPSAEATAHIIGESGKREHDGKINAHSFGLCNREVTVANGLRADPGSMFKAYGKACSPATCLSLSITLFS